VLERLDVNGSRKHPMYHYLKRHSSLYRPSRGKSLPVPWNFSKFLVNKAGNVVSPGFFGPVVSPLELEETIRKVIAESS